LVLFGWLWMVPAVAATNYCQDPAANQEWAEQIRANSGDKLLLRLFALRLGLCEMVRWELITLSEATALFETERVRAVQERQLEELDSKADIPA